MEALGTSLRSGARVAIVAPDAVVMVPGEVRGEPGVSPGPNASILQVSPVVRNAVALCAMFRPKLGAFSTEPGEPHQLVGGAMRCAQSYVLESGFARCSSRASRLRPRSSLFAEDCPKCASDPARNLYSAISSELAPNHSAVEPSRFLLIRRVI